MSKGAEASTRLWMNRRQDAAPPTIPEGGMPEDDTSFAMDRYEDDHHQPKMLGGGRKSGKKRSSSRGRLNETSRQLSRFSLTSQASSFSQLERADLSSTYRPPPPQTDCCACLGAAVRWCFGVDPSGREMLNRRDRRLVAQHEKLGPLGEGLLVAPPPPKLEHSITDRVRDQVYEIQRQRSDRTSFINPGMNGNTLGATRSPPGHGGPDAAMDHTDIVSLRLKLDPTRKVTSKYRWTGIRLGKGGYASV
ncbi:hypothetical protein FOZ61_003495 [Perkinsus olseni]|uniref:Uncharacterized protein n=1 Tax=Perkinsus olseni TaxID=32597 RepID=A0A7J6LPC0_PEROL|nr:hypothetical protein FOZ61_003495 [Perkinsus olseni]